MRAWEFHGAGTPLRRVEKIQPIPAVEEVVVNVKAAGLCHTDVGILDGRLASIVTRRPLVLGHEIAGVITEVGPSVEGWEIGDRVAIYPGGTRHGQERDGGYADYTTARADELIRVPHTVPFESAAIATDAGMTAFHAVRVIAGAQQGLKIGVIGLGGLGSIGARIASAAGAIVYAAETNPQARVIGDELGVQEVVESVADLSRFALDVIIDFAGSGTSTSDAIEAINPGGMVVQVGIGSSETSFRTLSIVAKHLRLQGSRGGTRQDIEAVMQLMASGQLDPIYSTIEFDDIRDGLERLKNGGVRGRLVALGLLP